MVGGLDVNGLVLWAENYLRHVCRQYNAGWRRSRGSKARKVKELTDADIGKQRKRLHRQGSARNGCGVRNTRTVERDTVQTKYTRAQGGIIDVEDMISVCWPDFYVEFLVADIDGRVPLRTMADDIGSYRAACRACLRLFGRYVMGRRRTVARMSPLDMRISMGEDGVPIAWDAVLADGTPARETHGELPDAADKLSDIQWQLAGIAEERAVQLLSRRKRGRLLVAVLDRTLQGDSSRRIASWLNENRPHRTAYSQSTVYRMMAECMHALEMGEQYALSVADNIRADDTDPVCERIGNVRPMADLCAQVVAGREHEHLTNRTFPDSKWERTEFIRAVPMRRAPMTYQEVLRANAELAIAHIKRRVASESKPVRDRIYPVSFATDKRRNPSLSDDAYERIAEAPFIVFNKIGPANGIRACPAIGQTVGRSEYADHDYDTISPYTTSVDDHGRITRVADSR